MATSAKVMRMGLGEAMRRLLDVEIRFRHGLTTNELTIERNMLLEALNRVEIQLGFDCNEDGVPDSVDIFRESSETSCCRIVDLPGVTPTQSGPRAVAASAAATVSSSRLDPVKAPKVVKTHVAPAAAPTTGFFNKMFTPENGKKKK